MTTKRFNPFPILRTRPLLSEAQWREIFHLPPEQGRPQESDPKEPSRELARLRQENAKLQTELKRLKTPPPGAPSAPTDALP